MNSNNAKYIYESVLNTYQATVYVTKMRDFLIALAITKIFFFGWDSEPDPLRELTTVSDSQCSEVVNGAVQQIIYDFQLAFDSIYALCLCLAKLAYNCVVCVRSEEQTNE